MAHLMVSAIEPYSIGDECASVTLQSGQAEIITFCFPCSLRVGESIENRLSILDGEIRAVCLLDSPDKDAHSEHKLERIGNYAYRGTGQVVNLTEGLVECLCFILDFEHVPCDGAVEFEIQRIDV